jgi:hypothetical protein
MDPTSDAGNIVEKKRTQEAPRKQTSKYPESNAGQFPVSRTDGGDFAYSLMSIEA